MEQKLSIININEYLSQKQIQEIEIQLPKILIKQMSNQKLIKIIL